MAEARELTNKIEPRPGEMIPTEEIKRMVDVLINLAKSYPPTSEMHQACLHRANHYMDLVDSWRKSMRPLPAGESDPRD